MLKHHPPVSFTCPKAFSRKAANGPVVRGGGSLLTGDSSVSTLGKQIGLSLSLVQKIEGLVINFQLLECCILALLGKV